MNYYKILGVLNDAEHIVIVAAYRALANRYHPDKWSGDKDFSHRKMSQINEAYATLSDPIKRAEYDSSIDKNEYFSEDTSDSEFNDPIIDELEDRWLTATELFPDLLEIKKSLRKVSHRLFFAYMVTLLEEKKFNERHDLAKLMKWQFLSNHFGTNKEIIIFAEKLISLGNKKAIYKLNRYIDVFGSDVEHEIIISKIKNEFDVESALEKNEKILREQFAKAHKERLERERIAKEQRERFEESQRINEEKRKTLKKFLEEGNFSDALEVLAFKGYLVDYKDGGFFSPDDIKVYLDKKLVFDSNSRHKFTRWAKDLIRTDAAV
jgi:curved DNA-binding protein CbpA